MMNLFRKNEQTTSFVAEQPEMLELNEQELEQTTGGCGHHHRRWHKEYRRDHHGRVIVVIIYED
jgi:hypothetical protein